ncbi:lysophospholipid acyltransferase [Pichia californica]|uniref:Lysophospholipid acyltransferase n=1 Tax=Pichia californica TaxID=460514 RepID=A0A9P6WNY5_9ASCO|nr:lysophospholipid acyltransferase [[Candida] californica]
MVESLNPFRYLIDYLCGASGLDVASVKTLVCLFLSFPISAIFKRLPDNNYKLKNIYIITASAIYIFFILQIFTGFFVILFNALFTYYLTKYYKSRFMPWVNLIVLMSVLCFNHIHAQLHIRELNPGEIDFTGAQMVMDGQLFHKDKSKFEEYLNVYQKSRAILHHPSLSSYLGYVFFYASLITGPSFDYADYEKFILTDLFDDVPDSKKPGKKRKRKIPKSGRVALRKVLQGFIWVGLFIYLTPKITVEYSLSNSFKNKSFIYKLIFLWILGLVERLKYYAVWLISEGSCIVVGLGYNGYDSEKDILYWNRVQNIDPISFELGQNVHDCLEAWNMNTNKWLKNFIYLRTCTRDRKTGKLKVGIIPTIITFATSAFWHGTLPGYYLTFILGAFMQTVGKIARRNFRPIFATKDNSNISSYKIYYDIASWIITQLTFGYAVQPFVILKFKESIDLWKSCYFWVHVGCLITILTFNGPFGKQASKFFKKYHLKNKEIEKIEKEPVPVSIQLAYLKDQFDSTTDLLDVLRTASVDKQIDIELPEFDNQEELKNTTVFEFDNLENDFKKLTKEFSEWKAESLQGKEPKQITDEEILRMKLALNNVQADIKAFVDALTAAKK